MKKLGKVLLGIVLVVLAIVLAVLGIRFVNGLRYPGPPARADSPANPTDAASYPTSHPGLTIERVQGDYLNGFHLKPDAVRHSGLVVIWGGSDGGPDFSRARFLAEQGYQVVSLFFFGQPNQKPRLAEVPLDFFDEVLAWRSTHVPEGPLTVIGTSKGAELALVLQERYPEIDNVVVYTPTRHVWQGLDFSSEKSSWTWHGEPLPYVSFRHASGQAVGAMFSAMIFNTPIRLREQYTTAAAGDPGADAARIQFRLRGHLLAFGGDQDAMWDGDLAASAWGEEDPPRTEAKVFPGVGHVFGKVGSYAAGFELGGTEPANESALTASNGILDAHLAEWHPAP